MSLIKYSKAGNSSAPVASPQMGELEFRRFQKLIFDAAGIHLAPIKLSMVEGRLAKRLKALQLPDFVSYVRYIDLHEAEYQLVVDLLTTNETYFFREPKHFEFLREQVLRQLPNGQKLQVWSAACSSGEEPYSIAMLLENELGNKGWSILASDISQQVLLRAKLGLYPLSRTEGIPQAYLKKFCLRGIDQEAGNLLVDKKLREKVAFSQVNLLDPPPGLPQFDVIFLRNVLIYFQAETKERVVMQVIKYLRSGGYLFIGHSETLNGLECGLQQVAPAIYRKPL